MSTPLLRLTPEVEPDEATVRAVEAGLNRYNESMAPGGDWESLWIVGRDLGGDVRAGLRGLTGYSWLFVSWFWVAEPYRRRGVGSQLLLGAEAIARDRGCAHVYVDTFSFQAPDFYKRHGFAEFGRLEEFPPGHSRIWLAKRL